MPFPVPLTEGRAACADRLDLVDAAYRSPGQSDELRRLCRHCPIRLQCDTHAMTHGEWGVWGGDGPHSRTRRGGARPRGSRPTA